MDLTQITNFIRPELLILVVVLWVIGLFLKKAPSFTQEWQIPFILLFIGVIFTILWVAVVIGEGWAAAVIISALAQGILVAALAVFGNELITQVLEKRITDKERKL
jgi:succinate-acetate transporter protein